MPTKTGLISALPERFPQDVRVFDHLSTSKVALNSVKKLSNGTIADTSWDHIPRVIRMYSTFEKHPFLPR